ncbi:MAG: sigma factor-like helix-turn-helix DNA-binding protein, partial [bacterium]|nr:sigma factor-like helix-turn-helix DNA-binding protein [bacterium]
MVTLSTIVKELTSGLNPRQKDVLTKRFCLDQKSKEGLTLAELGESYGITRERIRQIEAGALSEVRRKIGESSVTKSILASAHKHIESEEGVARESAILSVFKNEFGLLMQPSHLSFLLEAEGKVSLYPEDKDLFAFWYKDKPSYERAQET